MDNLLKDMGKRIFDRRKQLNMTQETLAELALPIMIFFHAWNEHTVLWIWHGSDCLVRRRLQAWE